MGNVTLIQDDYAEDGKKQKNRWYNNGGAGKTPANFSNHIPNSSLTDACNKFGYSEPSSRPSCVQSIVVTSGGSSPGSFSRKVEYALATTPLQYRKSRLSSIGRLLIRDSYTVKDFLQEN